MSKRDVWRHPERRVRWKQRLRPRWRVAEAFNRSRAWCWADLVPWALRWDVEPLLSNRRGVSCQVESAICGSCYCGKFADGDLRPVVSSTPREANE